MAHAFCSAVGSNALASLMVDYLVKPIERRVRYLFRFRKIVQDLGEHKNNLTRERTRVKEDVKEAKLSPQTQVIEKYVEDWLADATTALNDVQSLELRIGENKKCFRLCPNWCWRYQLSKTMDKEILSIIKLVDNSKFERIGHRAELHGLEFLELKGFVASKSSTEAFNRIMEALKDGESSNMIGVWGMGGVGKTTLVTVVGQKAKESQLFQKIINVAVSQTPIIENIQNKIADFIDLTFTKTTKEGKAEELYLRLEKEEKVLIILDDMWKELSLKEIGIPTNANRKGCKILLTTRRRAVCGSMDCQVTVPIDVLDGDEAWKLFKNKAEPDERFSREAQVVANECKGLPVAIVTLARALKGTKTRQGWELALKKLERNKLPEIGNIAEEDKNAYMCIKTSYDYLKNQTKKTCFLLCALYPEDHSIDVEDLVRHAWALELYGKADSVQEVRIQVMEDVDHLKDSCLLLDDTERNVKLHDIVRDVALWIASKKESDFVINSRLELLNESSEHCKAISLLNNERKKILESCVQSKLEILLLRNCELPGTCIRWMKNLKVLSFTAVDGFGRLISLYALKSLENLRALHLAFFEDISFLGDLRTLEIFSLDDSESCIDVEALANELVRLENLKILDLSRCRIFPSTLPAYVIEKLSKLEELYLKGLKTSEEILVAINSSPAKLTALSLSLDSSDIRKDYVFPKSLVRYDISIEDPNGFLHLTEKSWNIYASGIIPYYLVSLLSEDLESLVLESNIDDFMKVLLTDKNFKLSNLKLLHLQQHHRSELSRLTELPYQQVRLEGLVDLKIVNFPSLKSLFPLSVAQNLVLLETLEIHDCNGLEQIVTELEGNEEEISSSTINSQTPLLCFPKLRKLKVENCDGLEYIFPTLMAPQGLQSLTLSIRRCHQLKQLIRLAEDGLESDLLHQQQLEALRSLPSISVWDCPHLTDSAVHLEPAEACLEEVRFSAFKELFRSSKQLQLRAIEDVECLVDSTLSTENGPTSSAFTNLETLIIHKIDDLETLCKGQPPQGFLKNLKKLVVGDCMKLKSLFSTSLIRSLQLLENLYIEKCDALETLFLELENDGEKELESSSHPPCLPKLKTVRISNCPKLEYVVPITLAQGLPALAFLYVLCCGELKQVFGMPKENHGVEEHGILQLLLPSLEDLHLESLDKLTSFVPEEYIVKAPALKSLKVEGCPRVMNFPIQQVNQLKLKGVLLSSAFKDVLCNAKHLTLKSIGGVLSSAFKELLCNTKHLTLDDIGGPKNLVPEVVGIEYLEGLTSLHIDRWWSVECLVDSTLTEAMMGSKYKVQPSKLLSNLEHLQLKDSRRLRWIVKGSSHCVNFQSLKALTIRDCYRLEYLFPLHVLQALSLLEELEIEMCRELKSLFMKLESDDDVGMESNTLCLPNLKTVKITDCQRLEYVFPHALARGGFPSLQKLHLNDVENLRSIVAGNCFLEAPALEILYIKRCSEITNFTIRKQFDKRFPLKKLTIHWNIDWKKTQSEDAESCNMVNTELRQRSPNRTHLEQLFETQGGNFLSTLEELDLSNWVWLRDIWKSSIHVATNLRQLTVSSCDNLTRIFPVMLLPHLPQLSTLYIFSCEKLKQIIAAAADDDDDILASSSSSQGVQLMEMKMVFPQLKEIYLYELSSLESFSPEGYHSEFPCLESLDVKKCSNMVTSFSVDYTTLTVHAKADQASQLGDTASSSAEHIRWRIRKPFSLPEYVEEIPALK